MPEQMSLFPETDLTSRKELPVEGELNALDEIFTATRRFRSRRYFLDMLDFIARFANYSPFNGFLLYIQNPDITYVATARTWLKRFKRQPAAHARPLIILAPMSPVRFVYDIADTDGEPVSALHVQASIQHESFNEAVLKATVHNCAVHGILFREMNVDHRSTDSATSRIDETQRQDDEFAPDLRMNDLIFLDNRLSTADRYTALVYELAGIFCGHRGRGSTTWWPDRQNIDTSIKTTEAEAVAYLVCSRKNLIQHAAGYLVDYRAKDPELPLVGFSGILQATQYIETMGRGLWKKPRKTT